MGRGIIFIYVTLLGILTTCFQAIEGVDIGVNYGLLGDNLPPPDKVVALYRSRNITKLRLFNPNSTVLEALQHSGIDVVLGTFNQDLAGLATNKSFATDWVTTNVSPYADSVNFRYITAGNEVIPGDLASYVLPAMRNLRAALKSANIKVHVSTAVSTSVLGVSYPPSNSSFSEASGALMAPIVAYLEHNQTPLLVNVYPYFAYVSDTKDIKLEYALFQTNNIVVQDNSLGYTNLFDAMVDSVYTALEKAGGSGVEVVVSETGWPSGGGGTGATIDNARTYNNNVAAHTASGRGTPKRPGKATETYLFAMFNENQKPAGTEQNFGLYHPDMTEVYPLDFSS